ncbi:MAG TPA: flagellin [Paraburkholderia sp.]|jgi:flagellin
MSSSLFIASNNNSLIAQQNLNASGNLLQQSITRLSSGKRINSAADDPAGLAISQTMQTQIAGLNQGVQNANNATSVVQTAGTGLAQIVTALQTIRSIANNALGGTLSPSNQAALQQGVAEQIAEVNRIASQTTFNGVSLLAGSAGILNIQVGANVGQSVAVDLSQGLSAGSLGGGFVQTGNTLGTISGLNLNADGSENTSGAQGAIQTINVLSNGTGGFTFTDQNNQAISSAATAALFTITTTNGIESLSLTSGTANAISPANELTAIDTAFSATATTGTVFGTISGINVDPTTGKDAVQGTPNAITSVTVEADGKGGVQFVDQHGNQLSTGAAAGLFSGAGGGLSFVTAPTSTIGAVGTTAQQPTGTVLASINSNNAPTSVAAVNVSTVAGANLTIETIDNALATVANIQATIGAAQQRMQAISQAQQNESTNLSTASAQITNADFAAETANLSEAQVLQQAGISVLAQANAQPQQVLKLLQ